MTSPRREFLRHAALWRPAAAGRLAPDDLGYGPLRPVSDESTGLPRLQLPEGFRYRSW